MQKKNILLMTSVFNLGGAEKITHDIVSRLNRGKYELIFCSLYHPGAAGAWFIRDGYRFYHDLMKNRFDMTVILKIRKIIRHHNIKLIYLINQPLTILWGVIFGKLFNLPVVSVIHNMMVTENSVELKIYRSILPSVSQIIAVAHAQKEYWIKSVRLPAHLVTVIPNGIDMQRFTLLLDRLDMLEKKRSLGLDPEHKVVGIVARLFALKGIDIFLQAASLIIKRFERVQFVIVGDGPESQKMRSLASELSLDRRVHFLGTRDDVNDLVGIFDVAVLCSRTEALPMVLLEYMAAGRAVVATQVGCVAELVEDGATGILVEKENPEALAAGILWFLEHEKKAQEMGNRARQFVQDRFRIENTVSQTEQLIDAVIAEWPFK